MIQVVIEQSLVDDEIEGASKYIAFYENGHQNGKLGFSYGAIETLMAAFKAVNIKVVDLTAPAEQEDETKTDV